MCKAVIGGNDMNVIIRQEEEADYKETEAVIKAAFKDEVESDQTEDQLVAKLRQDSEFIPELSLVALDETGGAIVGHILLSKIYIVNEDERVISLALAPVSVLPKYQNQGIGKALIEHALEVAKSLGYESVIVLGHPDYYPKFGFKKATHWGIKAPFDAPEEAFMALSLKGTGLDGVSGTVEYPEAFL